MFVHINRSFSRHSEQKHLLLQFPQMSIKIFVKKQDILLIFVLYFQVYMNLVNKDLVLISKTYFIRKLIIL